VGVRHVTTAAARTSTEPTCYLGCSSVVQRLTSTRCAVQQVYRLADCAATYVFNIHSTSSSTYLLLLHSTALIVNHLPPLSHLSGALHGAWLQRAG
jgi:hypothetical protein